MKTFCVQEFNKSKIEIFQGNDMHISDKSIIIPNNKKIEEKKNKITGYIFI